jgi:hypothetical protein
VQSRLGFIIKLKIIIAITSKQLGYINSNKLEILKELTAIILRERKPIKQVQGKSEAVSSIAEKSKR